MFKCSLLRTIEVALNPVPPSCIPIRALLRKRLFNSHSSLPRSLKDYHMAAEKGKKEGGTSTASALVMSSPTPSLWASPWLWAQSPSPLLLPEQEVL